MSVMKRNWKHYRILSLFFLGMILTGCNIVRLDFTFIDDREFENLILDQDQDAYPEIDPMALSPEIIAYMNQHVKKGTPVEMVDQLQTLLFDKRYLNIEYDDSQTRTAIETFAARKGNCLSVVYLYIAMARYYDLDAHFQTVLVRPSWDRRGELLVLSQHINAIGSFSPNTSYVVDFTPEITLQQLTASRVKDIKARALFFNNLGAEKLIANEYSDSISYFKNALFLDPELSISWNNIGTAYSRSEQKEIAEYAYRKAFSIDRSNTTAVSNLVKFYNREGDYDTAERYAKAIERFNMKNPYFHYNLGNIAYSEGDYEAARDHFINAIKRKDSEADFYLALSKTVEVLGELEQAKALFEVAKMIYTSSSEIYRPSNNKVRIIDEKSILRSSSAGFSVRANSL